MINREHARALWACLIFPAVFFGFLAFNSSKLREREKSAARMSRSVFREKTEKKKKIVLFHDMASLCLLQGIDGRYTYYSYAYVTSCYWDIYLSINILPSSSPVFPLKSRTSPAVTTCDRTSNAITSRRFLSTLETRTFASLVYTDGLVSGFPNQSSCFF